MTSILAFEVAGQAQEPVEFRTAFPVGALRNASPADAKVAASVLLKRIVHQQGYEYSTDIPETSEQFIKSLRAGRYDFFLIETLDYLDLSGELAMIPRVAGASGEGDPMETFLLLVRSDVASEGLAGLKGKRLFFDNSGQSLAEAWLEVQMAEQGLGKPENHFAEIEVRGGCSDCALPVFFGEVDACIVTKSGFDVMCELNPQLSKRLTAIEASEPLLVSLMCLREGFVERNPGQIDDVSTSLHNKPDGQQILNMMRVQRLVLWDERFIESVKRLVVRHRLLTDPLASEAAPAEVSSDAATASLGEPFSGRTNTSATADAEPPSPR